MATLLPSIPYPPFVQRIADGANCKENEYTQYLHILEWVFYIPPIGVIHRYDDTQFQQFICYGHKSIGKYVLKFTKFSVSYAFLRN